MRDVKKLGLLPSVTTILSKTLSKPELDKWKARQIIKTTQAYPKLTDEDEEAYFVRINELAFQQVVDAADKGTAIHAAVEAHFQGKEYDPELSVYVAAVEHWATENCITFIAQEKRLVCLPEGYAGTTDAIISVKGKDGFGVFDMKTRKSRPEYPMKPYSTEPIQISAYSNAVKDEYQCVFGVNLFVSSTEPGRVEDAWYSEEEMISDLECFRHINAVFQYMNGYDPEKYLVDTSA